MLRIFARFYGIKNPILAFKNNRTSIIYTNYMAHNAYRSTEKGNVYSNTRSYSNNNVLFKQEKMSHKVRVLTKRH
jgi:hypothetical protein